MMTIPTYVAPSVIEGVGLFASVPIRAGDCVWVLNERFDVLLTREELETLPDLQREFINRYAYWHMTRPGILVLEFDNGRFMNHSERPNTDFRDPLKGWAIRDIVEGDELTCNYAEFDPSYVMQPGRKFVEA
jgi:hypothetical protein